MESKIVKMIEAESRMMIAGGAGRREEWDDVGKGYKVPVTQNE